MDDCDKRMRCDSYLKATFLSVLCESEIKHINRGVSQGLGGWGYPQKIFLLQQHHLPCLYKLTCLDLVKVYSCTYRLAMHICSIPLN